MNTHPAHSAVSIIVAATLCLLCSVTARALDYNYEGTFSLCGGSCLSFAALTGPPTTSAIGGSINIDVAPGAGFSAADVAWFGFLVASPVEPLEPFDGTNATTANPLPVDMSVAAIRESVSVGGTVFRTGGTTDASGALIDGTLLFEFMAPPFSSNSAWVIFDVATGTAQVCLFFATSGCIVGATQTVVIDGAFNLDAGADIDGDGVGDNNDNCSDIANADQRDSNGDGFGNLCDADLNDDCIVNPVDLGLFRSRFFSTDPDADFDGNGIVNVVDMGIFRVAFFSPPGPAAEPNGCTPAR